jgi:glutamine---fructose-6-phosphate transaminase (isomerizing)
MTPTHQREVPVETLTSTKLVTYSEILTQADAWQQALEVVAQNQEGLRKLSQESFDRVLFTGCGSTYYLALAAAAIFQELTGLPARGVPASELWLYPETIYVKNSHTLLVAISRSAETTETIIAVNEFIKRKTGVVLTVTNFGQKSLATMGFINLTIESGQEVSIAQTRAFTSMYVCITALATIISGRDDLFQEMYRLPETGLELMKRYELLAQQIGTDLTLDRFYFLGSGPRYGLACEANLKMKEMSLTHSEPFHFLEFRHGPKSMANKTTALLAFLSSSRRAMEEKVLLDMRPYGVRQISIADTKADIVFPNTLPESVTNVLYLPIMQLMAYYRSLAKGLDPDRPSNLDAVVKIDKIE